MVPILLCDVRRRESSKQLLVALTEHVIERASLSAGLTCPVSSPPASLRA